MIVTAAALISFSGLALASAMLATTPACELLTETEASKALGHKMVSMGGTADIAFMSECFWHGEDGGPALDFRYMEAGLFSPGGGSARSYLDHNIEALKGANEPFEIIEGVGEGALMTEQEDTRFLSLASGGGYLTISLRESTREAILAIGKIAAKKMAD